MAIDAATGDAVDAAPPAVAESMAVDAGGAAVVAEATPVADRRLSRVSFGPASAMRAADDEGRPGDVREGEARAPPRTPMSERRQSRVSFGPDVESPKPSRVINHKKARISPAIKRKKEHGPLLEDHWLNQAPRERTPRSSRRSSAGSASAA